MVIVLNGMVLDRWWRVLLLAFVFGMVVLYWFFVYNFLDGEDVWNWVLEGDWFL